MMTGNPRLPSLRQQLAQEHFLPEVLDAWESEGITALLPIQVKALERGCLNNKCCLIIGPTSSGKTFIGEMLAVKHIQAMRKCLYLVPFKALAEEKWVEFRRKYDRPEIGARIIISTADRRDLDRQVIDGDFDIAILTYEKLSSLLVLHPNLLKEVGALIVDEIQIISDETRGAELELLLTRAKEAAPDLQIVGLSAVVSSMNGFDIWLNAEVISDDHRPVTLREGVMEPSGKFDYVEWIASERSPGSELLKQSRDKDKDKRIIAFVSHLLTDKNQQVIIFVNAVRRTHELAQALAAEMQHLPPAAQSKKAISVFEETESISVLTSTLDRSIAFHNADLTLDERLAVESGFRSGEIRCIVTTSTLSMGVNLPASTVVIADHKKWTKGAASGWGEIPISVNEYRNMSGRAGRFGLRSDNLGRSVLFAESPVEQKGLLAKYVNGKPAPLKSAFMDQPLDVRVLRLFASGLCDSASGVTKFLLKTYAATKNWKDTESRNTLDQNIQDLVILLATNGLIKKDDKRVFTITRTGRICASSGLTLETFKTVLQIAKDGIVSALDIAVIASLSDEAGPNGVNLRLSTEEYHNRTPFFVSSLRAAATAIESPLAQAMLDDLPDSSLPAYETIKTLKYQAIAIAYISGIASRDIENKFGVSSGRARVVGAMCAWLCDNVAAVAWANGKSDNAKALERLGDRFLYGCSDSALFLSQVRHNLHRQEREALVGAGFTSFQKIVDTSAEAISKTANVSRGRVTNLQKAIVAALGDSLALERQQISRLDACGVAIGPIEALYTAKGKMLEQAIEDILVPQFCSLNVSRISSQREGEADLKLILSTGRNGIAQVTAKDRPTDKIGMGKAGAVLQQCPELHPVVFICFGRPGFDDTAIKKANAHAKTGANYKMISIPVLAEMYVRYREGKMEPTRVTEILETLTGHITIDRL